MISPRVFLCNGARAASTHAFLQDSLPVALDSLGPTANVHISFHDVARVFGRNVGPRLVDLLEIAAYVYTADSAINRGDGWVDDNSTEPWSRDFRFLIGVRDLDFWQQDQTVASLIKALSFLSNDRYSFEFQALTRDRDTQLYLEFSEDEDWPFYDVDRVLMFSGGLDSLAGALETASKGLPLVLVSHRPVGTIDKRQRELFAELQRRYPNQFLHIPVWVNKEKQFGREFTQRSRSFLYSALGVLVAESLRAGGVRFFENGVVSLNLPVADEVTQARASRTTHPLALQNLQEFFRLVTGRDLTLDNPFLEKTKAEVVQVIADNNQQTLIGQTCSCAHTGYFQSKTQWHCGTCSQCIDRRVAIFAAGLEAYDSSVDYVSDVFTGVRKDGYERNMAVNFTRHAIELARMDERELVTKFNAEFSRAARPFRHRAKIIESFVELHIRHGSTVMAVLEQQLHANVSGVLTGTLEPSCLLNAVFGRLHLESTWVQYAGRIYNLLRQGLPTACRSHAPLNEPHLQELCDGILKAHDLDLVREYPFLRWSSSLTKPDWSDRTGSLVVELKYVRKREDIRPITAAIAEDITKYGDNGKSSLFVIYDPRHLIVDEAAFSEPMHQRPKMFVRFIR